MARSLLALLVFVVIAAHCAAPRRQTDWVRACSIQGSACGYKSCWESVRQGNQKYFNNGIDSVIVPFACIARVYGAGGFEYEELVAGVHDRETSRFPETGKRALVQCLC